MKIISPIHGEFIYKKEDIIVFNKSIPGFAELNKFILKNIDDESPFMILQSIEDANVGFITISPFTILNDYEVKLNDDIISSLEIKEPTDVGLYCIVTLSNKITEITANLKAPIVININNKKGEQFIMENTKYNIKHPIMKG